MFGALGAACTDGVGLCHSAAWPSCSPGRGGLMRCRALALGRITPKPLSCMPLLLRLLGIRSPEPGSRSTGRMLLRAEPLANVCPSRCSQWGGVLLLTLECLDLCVTDACVPGAPISFSVVVTVMSETSSACRRGGSLGGWHTRGLASPSCCSLLISPVRQGASARRHPP